MKIMYKGYQIFMEYRCQNGHYSFEKLYDFIKEIKLIQLNQLYVVSDMKLMMESRIFIIVTIVSNIIVKKIK